MISKDECKEYINAAVEDVEKLYTRKFTWVAEDFDVLLANLEDAKEHLTENYFRRPKNTIEYSAFLFSQLFMLRQEFANMEYDLAFPIMLRHMHIFEQSKYNDENKSEYDCIIDYLNNIDK